MPDSIAHITHQASTAPAAVTGRTPSPRTVKKPLRAPAQADSIAREKAIADSTAYADSVSAASKLTKAIVVTDPSAPYADAPPKGMDTASWVIAAMALLFCLVGLRYRGNARFLKGMLRQAVELRERNNMFDETVRESLFTLLVTLLSGPIMHSAGLCAPRRFIYGSMHRMHRKLYVAAPRIPADIRERIRRQAACHGMDQRILCGYGASGHTGVSSGTCGDMP